MKKFIIQVLATIVGIMLLTGIAFLGILFISMITSGSSATKVKEGSVLEITLNRPILESPTEKSISLLSIEDDREIYLKDILDLIQYAKNDEKIKGISLKLAYIEGGYSEVSEIRKAIEDFKKSKKFVYAYTNTNNQKSYYLASVADSLFLNPEGGVELTGLSMEVMFFKNMGEKYGIDFDVIRHGRYKSAVEPFLRENLSEENRLQLTELIGGIWSKVSTDIANSRKIPQDEFNIITDSLYGFVAESSLEHKLVDKLINESQYDQIIKKKLGQNKEEEVNKISLLNYKETTSEVTEADKIAILYASGEIRTGKGDDGIYTKNFIKEINKIKEDEEIKAVVLRINSPGGSANASAEIYYELNELKKKKPIIVSFSDMAASGGYYIAMAGDKIYAQENTITGSIGVFGMIPNIKKMANNVGITTDYVETNANSINYSLTQGMSEGARTRITQGIELIYEKFVGVVMKGRGMTFEQVDNLGGGRIWSGKQAIQNGLIDEIGTFDDAIKFAAKKAKLTQYSTVAYPQEKTSWELFLEQIKRDEENESIEESKAVQNMLKKELGMEKYKIYQKVKNIDKGQGVMYLMPFELTIK